MATSALIKRIRVVGIQATPDGNRVANQYGEI
jgi:hypothetical protein